ncbi:radical SAM protein [Saccharothrix sp. NPDC042600]|uniref:B12-binding domain-containing radical SAM protein n=1 Tax=Saccharothrix TaxID=2071 RepID=UPI0033E6DF57|nr:hypothetical protein GCM10017745_50510 [Saccharothrix mutabilis subsp. capreolus]
MRFCIVSPPTVSEFGPDLAETEVILRLAEHAPVGVLTLAAVLEQRGRRFDVVDLNQVFYEHLKEPTAEAFREYAVERLLALDPDVIGLGTICSSFPLTLRIAERLKRARPEVRIVLGGPQASVVDTATLTAFPSVDFVLRFEAEESLPALLDALDTGADLRGVPGLSFREGGTVVRTANAPAIADLDAIPVPAYHRYPPLRSARYIPLELGRGCPYGCTFCSTNDFFRRKFRLKTPALVVEQMTRLKAEYGVGVFDLIHDMFTVDRAKVVEFCEAILASGEEFFWNCSARTDRVDDELLDLMSSAGCRGVFFGIESGSQDLQRSLKKRLVLPDAMARVRSASDRGMQVAASLITGFPDEHDEDFRDTADFFVNSLRYERAQPQLHILAPLADTPLHRQFKDQLVFDDIISDMSHQGWAQDPADRDLIARHPAIFPNFYAIPTPLDREFLKEIRGFLLHGAQWMRWLLVVLHQEVAHIVDIFKDFQAWRAQQPREGEDGSDSVRYFSTQAFRTDFTRFVRTRICPTSDVAPALTALAAYAGAFDDIAVDDPTRDAPGGARTLTRRAFTHTSVPKLADSVRIMDVDVDFAMLVDCLVEGRPVATVTRRPHRLASRKLPGRWPEVLQLSPASMSLLELCDGERTVANIGVLVESASLGLPGIPADKYCLVGLELLRHDGLVEDDRWREPEPEC